jgi:hypothetical protein
MRTRQWSAAFGALAISIRTPWEKVCQAVEVLHERSGVSHVFGRRFDSGRK